MKKPLLKLKYTTIGVPKIVGEAFDALIEHLCLIEKNLEIIYDLLPEREVYKKIEPAVIDLKICDACNLKDLKTNMPCDCNCHKLSFTATNSTGTQYITPEVITQSIIN